MRFKRAVGVGHPLENGHRRWRRIARPRTGGPEGSAETHAAERPAVLIASDTRDVSIRKLPRNIFQDEKEIVLFPKQLAKGKHWWPTIGIVGGTTALIASDPYTAPAFRNTTRLRGFNRDISSVNTAAFIVAVPAAIYGVGLLRKDSYAKDCSMKW